MAGRVIPPTERVQIAASVVGWLDGKAVVWGSTDCAKMALRVLRLAGRKIRVSKFGQYRDAEEAAAALERGGVKDTAEILDDLGLERVAPASAWVGDLIGWPTDTFTALGLKLSNGLVLLLPEGSAVWRRTRPVFTSAEGLKATAWRLS